ncbi:MAG: hypothetical protein ACI4I3_02235, partial [Acutalibacteraceae bacterium]
FFRRANTVRPYRVADKFCCFYGTAGLFRFNNRFGRERRPRRSVGFDMFSRTAARAVPTICFSICRGRCPHRPNEIYFIICLWRIGSSGTPNPTDFAVSCAYSNGTLRTAFPTKKPPAGIDPAGGYANQIIFISETIKLFIPETNKLLYFRNNQLFIPEINKLLYSQNKQIIIFPKQLN